jgi:hypothetical protein
LVRLFQRFFEKKNLPKRRLFDGFFLEELGAPPKNQHEPGAKKGACTGFYPMFFFSSTLHRRRSCRRNYISNQIGCSYRALHENKAGSIFLEEPERGLKLVEEEPYQTGS